LNDLIKYLILFVQVVNRHRYLVLAELIFEEIDFRLIILSLELCICLHTHIEFKLVSLLFFLIILQNLILICFVHWLIL